MRIEYAELNKVIKKNARADKRQFMEDLAETAKIVASENEMRTVNKITQKICVEISTTTASLLTISRETF